MAEKERWVAAPEIAGRALKNDREIRRAVRSASQAKVAERVGLSQTTVSRFHEDGSDGTISFIARVAAFLAACGLKAVDQDAQFYPREHIDALRTLARDSLENFAPSQFGAED